MGVGLGIGFREGQGALMMSSRLEVASIATEKWGSNQCCVFDRIEPKLILRGFEVQAGKIGYGRVGIQ